MKIWVAVTDENWYEHLGRLAPEEVNFWQPSGSKTFRVLQAGEPFLFKLHSPQNFIVGGGFFVRYSALPASPPVSLRPGLATPPAPQPPDWPPPSDRRAFA